ncbi:MAG TPA: rhomboid family intramembrane serine protease [Symbiobacteriaceae bacterium]|nr:rhomboid family intramembrane serine protease [Symbiobacteriaceae bacterium]
MVFPLRDSVPTRRRPWVTYSLVALNLVLFLVELGAGDLANDLLSLFAVVPTRVLSLRVWAMTGGWPLVTLVTSTFFHGSWTHLIGNMLYLWVFGDNIEDLLGRGRYLLFYLLCGVLANIAHVAANPSSQALTIGASGAVAGVLGGYLLRFPRAKILTLFPIGFLVPAVPIAASIYLVLWFLMQLFSGLAPIWVRDVTQTVAFWAHISGFLSGFALVRLLEPKRERLLPGG